MSGMERFLTDLHAAVEALSPEQKAWLRNRAEAEIGRRKPDPDPRLQSFRQRWLSEEPDLATELNEVICDWFDETDATEGRSPLDDAPKAMEWAMSQAPPLYRPTQDDAEA